LPKKKPYGSAYVWRQPGISGDIENTRVANITFFRIFWSCRPMHVQLMFVAIFFVLAETCWNWAFPVERLVWFIAIWCLGMVAESINTAHETDGDAVAALVRHNRRMEEILREAGSEIADRVSALNAEIFGPPSDDESISEGQRLEYNVLTRAMKHVGSSVTVPVALLAFSIEPLLIFVR
jgi:hypothetical protein